MLKHAVPAFVALALTASLAGLVLRGSAAATPRQPRFAGPTLTHPATAPDFVLRDQERRVVRLADQRGKVVLLTFLYTHCPDVCPLTAASLNTAIGLLGSARKRVIVLAVSVDAAGDTPAAVRSFAREHRLRPQFHYLTGAPKTLERVWHAYHVSAVRRGGRDVDHTLYTMLIDRSGKGRVLFDSLAVPAAIVHDVKLLLH